MARKGTAGRHPEKQIGATESGIDKAVKKTKEVFDGDNEAVDYDEVKGQEEQRAAKEYSERVSEEDARDMPKRK